jgi:putative transposase
MGQPLFITFGLHGGFPSHRPFPAANVTSGQAFVAMDHLLDRARSGPTFLAKPSIAELVLRSIQYGACIGHCDLHSWVIMPDPVHLLLTPRVSVSKLLGSLKAVTAKQANFLLNRTGQPFWQDENCDHLVRDGTEFRRIERYIENNPVAACLVATPDEYPWSSAAQAACEAAAGRGPAPR